MSIETTIIYQFRILVNAQYLKNKIITVIAYPKPKGGYSVVIPIKEHRKVFERLKESDILEDQTLNVRTTKATMFSDLENTIAVSN